MSSQRSKGVLRKSSRIIRLPGDNSQEVDMNTFWKRENKMSKAKEIINFVSEQKPLKPSPPGSHGFPRHAVKSVDTRKRDLVVRIANWLRDKDEPAYDVEVYSGGVYDNDASKTFALSSGLTKEQAKQQAIDFACEQIRKLL